MTEPQPAVEPAWWENWVRQSGNRPSQLQGYYTTCLLPSGIRLTLRVFWLYTVPAGQEQSNWHWRCDQLVGGGGPYPTAEAAREAAVAGTVAELRRLADELSRLAPYAVLADATWGEGCPGRPWPGSSSGEQLERGC